MLNYSWKRLGAEKKCLCNMLIYKSKEFRRGIFNVTKKCPGCQYGSFPEMTISTRTFGGMWDRLKSMLRSKKEGIIPHTYEHLLAKINKIKDENPAIYSDSAKGKFNNNLVSEWKKVGASI